jgi:type II secretory pathway pseudopilin PulG
MSTIRRDCSPAFTLVETLVSILVVGTLLITAVNLVGTSRVGQSNVRDRRLGALLAQALMAEILQTAYADPDETPVFGPEPTEGTSTRADWDDVDDYHGWSAMPPVDRDGTPVPDRADWQRTVTVDYVGPNDLLTAVGGDQGVKRILVEVTRNDMVLGSLTAIRTDPQ